MAKCGLDDLKKIVGKPGLKDIGKAYLQSREINFLEIDGVILNAAFDGDLDQKDIPDNVVKEGNKRTALANSLNRINGALRGIVNDIIALPDAQRAQVLSDLGLPIQRSDGEVYEMRGRIAQRISVAMHHVLAGQASTKDIARNNQIKGDELNAMLTPEAESDQHVTNTHDGSPHASRYSYSTAQAYKVIGQSITKSEGQVYIGPEGMAYDYYAKTGQKVVSVLQQLGVIREEKQGVVPTNGARIVDSRGVVIRKFVKTMRGSVISVNIDKLMEYERENPSIESRDSYRESDMRSNIFSAFERMGDSPRASTDNPKGTPLKENTVRLRGESLRIMREKSSSKIATIYPDSPEALLLNAMIARLSSVDPDWKNKSAKLIGDILIDNDILPVDEKARDRASSQHLTKVEFLAQTLLSYEAGKLDNDNYPEYSIPINGRMTLLNLALNYQGSKFIREMIRLNDLEFIDPGEYERLGAWLGEVHEKLDLSEPTLTVVDMSKLFNDFESLLGTQYDPEAELDLRTLEQFTGFLKRNGVGSVNARENYAKAHALLDMFFAASQAVDNGRHVYPIVSDIPVGSDATASGLFIQFLDRAGNPETFDSILKLGVKDKDQTWDDVEIKYNDIYAILLTEMESILDRDRKFDDKVSLRNQRVEKIIQKSFDGLRDFAKYPLIKTSYSQLPKNAASDIVEDIVEEYISKGDEKGLESLIAESMNAYPRKNELSGVLRDDAHTVLMNDVGSFIIETLTQKFIAPHLQDHQVRTEKNFDIQSKTNKLTGKSGIFIGSASPYVDALDKNVGVSKKELRELKSYYETRVDVRQKKEHIIANNRNEVEKVMVMKAENKGSMTVLHTQNIDAYAQRETSDVLYQNSLNDQELNGELTNLDTHDEIKTDTKSTLIAREEYPKKLMEAIDNAQSSKMMRLEMIIRKGQLNTFKKSEEATGSEKAEADLLIEKIDSLILELDKDIEAFQKNFDILKTKDFHNTFGPSETDKAAFENLAKNTDGGSFTPGNDTTGNQNTQVEDAAVETEVQTENQPTEVNAAEDARLTTQDRLTLSLTKGANTKAMVDIGKKQIQRIKELIANGEKAVFLDTEFTFHDENNKEIIEFYAERYDSDREKISPSGESSLNKYDLSEDNLLLHSEKIDEANKKKKEGEKYPILDHLGTGQEERFSKQKVAEDVLDALKELTNDGEYPIVAYNALASDLKILSSYSPELKTFLDNVEVIDPFAAAHVLIPNQRGGRKQTDMAKRYDIDVGSAHTSEEDVNVLAKVFNGIAKEEIQQTPRKTPVQPKPAKVENKTEENPKKIESGEALKLKPKVATGKTSGVTLNPEGIERENPFKKRKRKPKSMTAQSMLDMIRESTKDKPLSSAYSMNRALDAWIAVRAENLVVQHSDKVEIGLRRLDEKLTEKSDLYRKAKGAIASTWISGATKAILAQSFSGFDEDKISELLTVQQNITAEKDKMVRQMQIELSHLDDIVGEENMEMLGEMGTRGGMVHFFSIQTSELFKNEQVKLDGEVYTDHIDFLKEFVKDPNADRISFKISDESTKSKLGTTRELASELSEHWNTGNIPVGYKTYEDIQLEHRDRDAVSFLASMMSIEKVGSKDAIAAMLESDQAIDTIGSQFLAAKMKVDEMNMSSSVGDRSYNNGTYLKAIYPNNSWRVRAVHSRDLIEEKSKDEDLIVVDDRAKDAAGKNKGFVIVASPSTGAKQKGIGVSDKYDSGRATIPREMIEEYEIELRQGNVRDRDDRQFGISVSGVGEFAKYYIDVTTEGDNKLGRDKSLFHTIPRTMGDAYMVQETKVVRDEVYNSRFQLINSEKDAQALLDSIKASEKAGDRDYSWYIKIGPDVEMSNSVKELIDTYYKSTKDESVISSLQNMRENFEYVRKDIEHQVMGYKDLQFDPDTEMGKFMNKALDFVKNSAVWIKISTIVVDPGKIVADAASNITTLGLVYGMSPAEITRYSKMGKDEYDEWQTKRDELIMLNLKLYGESKETNRIDIMKEIREKNDEIEKLTFHQMFKEGLVVETAFDIELGDQYSIHGVGVSSKNFIDNIVRNGDGDPNSIGKSVLWLNKQGLRAEPVLKWLSEYVDKNKNKKGFQAELSKKLKGIYEGGKKIEKTEDVATFLSEVLAGPNAQITNIASSAIQQVDMVSRYALVKYLEDNRPNETKEERRGVYKEAREAFVDFRLNLPKEIKFASDVMISPYPAFFLRITKLLIKAARLSPVTTATALAYSDDLNLDRLVAYHGSLFEKIVTGDAVKVIYQPEKVFTHDGFKIIPEDSFKGEQEVIGYPIWKQLFGVD